MRVPSCSNGREIVDFDALIYVQQTMNGFRDDFLSCREYRFIPGSNKSVWHLDSKLKRTERKTPPLTLQFLYSELTNNIYADTLIARATVAKLLARLDADSLCVCSNLVQDGFFFWFGYLGDAA